MNLDGILEKAVLNNKLNGVTGCLVSYEKKFYQILEGSEAVIRKLFSIIEKDTRHENVRLISDGHTKERFFPEWGMAFYPADEGEVDSPELIQFRRNLFLFGDLLNVKSNVEKEFWIAVKNGLY